VHSSCAAGDEGADGGNAGVSLPKFKYASPSAIVAPPLIYPGPSHTARQQRRSVAALSAVALNLRYCVFLI
jgi:hypothetical protein